MNLKKKATTEEVNSVLASTLEGLLPKIAEECADLVFTRLSEQLEGQKKEIANMRRYIEHLEGLLQEKENFGDKINSPRKNLSGLSTRLHEMNNDLEAQNHFLKEKINLLDHGEQLKTIDKFKENIIHFKNNVQEEKRKTDMVNSNLKDNYVELLGLKKSFDSKFNFLVNQLKENRDDYNNEDCGRKLADLAQNIGEGRPQFSRGHQRKEDNKLRKKRKHFRQHEAPY